MREVSFCIVTCDWAACLDKVQSNYSTLLMGNLIAIVRSDLVHISDTSFLLSLKVFASVS